MVRIVQIAATFVFLLLGSTSAYAYCTPIGNNQWVGVAPTYSWTSAHTTAVYSSNGWDIQPPSGGGSATVQDCNDGSGWSSSFLRSQTPEGGNFVADASSSLELGSLRVHASAIGVAITGPEEGSYVSAQGSSQGIAQQSEVVRFDFPNACDNPSLPCFQTVIPLMWFVSGSYSIWHGGNGGFTANAMAFMQGNEGICCGDSLDLSIAWGNGQGFASDYSIVSQGGDWDDFSGGVTIFTGTLTLLGRNPSAYISQSLFGEVVSLDATYNHFSFGNTARFAFGELPEGTTWTSGSGRFLQGVPTGVPEPATLALLGLGLAGLGFSRRKQ